MRFLLGSFSIICYDLIFFVLIIALFSLTQSSIVALCQIDIKKIIAYSSIAHMNFAVLGFFSQHLLGMTGSFFMLFGHAITSSALFFCIGILYDRYGSLEHAEEAFSQVMRMEPKFDLLFQQQLLLVTIQKRVESVLQLAPPQNMFNRVHTPFHFVVKLKKQEFLVLVQLHIQFKSISVSKIWPI